MSAVIKLSSPATREYWEIPVLFEDAHVMALDKPTRLLVSADRHDVGRPNLMALLHDGIAAGKSWAVERGLSYLMNSHRLDLETSGILLLAKSKPILVELANLFGSEKPVSQYVALVHGSPFAETFEVDAKLAPHPIKPGLVRVDESNGKHSKTVFTVMEKFRNYTLLNCKPLTARTHQIRVHARHMGIPIAGDELYGGTPLLLSHLKSDYRLKPKKTENPLIGRVALHATGLQLVHPATGAELVVESPLPKDLSVAIKYLRKYAKV